MAAPNNNDWAQVASPEHVFIFDLLVLHSAPELDELLQQLFQSRSVVKLSMDASQDIKKLAGAQSAPLAP